MFTLSPEQEVNLLSAMQQGYIAIEDDNIVCPFFGPPCSTCPCQKDCKRVITNSTPYYYLDNEVRFRQTYPEYFI